MLFCGYPPDGIPYVVSDEHGTTPLDDDAHGSPSRFPVLAQETLQKWLRQAPCFAGLGHFNGDNLVTTWRLTVPGATLRNDGVVYKTWNGGV